MSIFIFDWRSVTLEPSFWSFSKTISLGVVKEDQLEKLRPFGVNLSTPLSELEYIPLAKQQSQLLRKKWGTTPYNVWMLVFRLQKMLFDWKPRPLRVRVD